MRERKFIKTSLRIYLSLMIITALLLTAVVVISGVITSRMLYNTYRSLAVQKLDRGVSSCKNYVESVLLSVENLSLDSQIIDVTLSDKNVSITQKLNDTSNYAKKINAITVYSSDGRIYSSSNLGGPPTLEELETDPTMKDFFTLSNPELISLRVRAVAEVYDGVKYEESDGMVSCCRKVYDESGKVCGYVVADVFPSNLYQFFYFRNDRSLSGSLPLIRFHQGYFPAEGNSGYLSDFSAPNETTSADGKYLMLTSPRNFFGGTIVVGIPLKTTKITTAFIFLIMSAGALLLLTATHFVAGHFARSVERRLENLMNKMDSEGLALPLGRN